MEVAAIARSHFQRQQQQRQLRRMTGLRRRLEEEEVEGEEVEVRKSQPQQQQRPQSLHQRPQQLQHFGADAALSALTPCQSLQMCTQQSETATIKFG